LLTYKHILIFLPWMLTSVNLSCKQFFFVNLPYFPNP
jgi:hypothetical protein